MECTIPMSGPDQDSDRALGAGVAPVGAAGLGSRAQPTPQRGPSWPHPAICEASTPPSGHLPFPRRQQLGGEQEAASAGQPHLQST